MSVLAQARLGPSSDIRRRIASFRMWGFQRWLTASIATTAAALLVGVPTGIIETDLYTRMTPVRWWDYPVWALSAVLVGLTVATYVRIGDVPPARDGAGRGLTATILATFAVGCPICNKLVVAVLGVSGALTYWAPLQPVVGILSVLLLATGLLLRLGGDIACAGRGRSPA